MFGLLFSHCSYSTSHDEVDARIVSCYLKKWYGISTMRGCLKWGDCWVADLRKETTRYMRQCSYSFNVRLLSGRFQACVLTYLSDNQDKISRSEHTSVV